MSLPIQKSTAAAGLFGPLSFFGVYNSSLRTLIQNSTLKHQFVIELEMTYRTMFRTLYLVRIKASIFNQSKSFDFLFSNDSWPSLFSFCSNFLVNPLPTSVYSTYKPLILDGFLKFLCFSLDLGRTNSKSPSLFLIVAANFW